MINASLLWLLINIKYSIFVSVSLLKPTISENFKGAIWRMEIDELTGILFVEIRDSAEKQVSFAAVNLLDGKIHFNNVTTPERWLAGMETAYDGVLLIHFYESVSTPGHKGLLAIDGFTGQELWSNYSRAFDHLSTHGPVVYDTTMQPKKYFLIDINTGVSKQAITLTVPDPQENNILIPEMLSQDLLPPDTIYENPYGNLVHYLEYNNFRIVSLHALEDEKLTQKLFISDGVNVVYEDLLNASIQKIQPEAFIVHKNRLIYIKNKSELKVLTL